MEEDDEITRQIIGQVDNPAQTPVKVDLPQFVIIMGAAAVGAVVGAVLGAPVLVRHFLESSGIREVAFRAKEAATSG